MDLWLKTGSCTSDRPVEASSGPAKKKKIKLRKYDKSYLSFGFSWTGTEEEPIPLCVICRETLSNDSMKPSNLKRHFEN